MPPTRETTFERFIDAIRKGHTRPEAAKLTRFPLASHTRRLRYGEPEATRQEEIISEAEAEAVSVHLDTVNQASREGSIKAAELALRMLRPEHFSQKISVNIENGVPRGIADEELEAKEKIYWLAMDLFKTEPHYLNRLCDYFDLLRMNTRQLPETVEGHFEDDDDK